jgi:histidine ammonia-lyase
MIVLDGFSLTADRLRAVARDGEAVTLAPSAIERVKAGQTELERRIAAGTPVYGVTTGFGALDKERVSSAHRALLQKNLLLSHAAGVGPALPREIVRAMMAARANVLAQGYPAVRLATLQRLLDALNRGLTPRVPEKGSLGACGDLQALAHCMLPLLGEGEAEVDGRLLPGREALKAVGLEPIVLEGRDGLALINGSEQASATAALVVADAVTVLKAIEIAAACAVEALRGLGTAFEEWISAAKPHPGQVRAAAHFRRLLQGSLIVGEQRSKLRDALSIRCLPQVQGAAWEALDWARATVERELNAANDNPLVDWSPARVNSNSGNFHGQAVAQAMDTLAASLTTVGVMSDRRSARLVDEKLSDGLPAFLVKPPAGEEGAHSGFMLAQYTSAALVAESRILAAPAGIQAVPTCANSEDHVSLAPLAARKARQILDHLIVIAAVEWLLACQGLDFRGPERADPGARAAHRLLRSRVPHWQADRYLAPDLEAAATLIRDGSLVAAVEAAVGPLH